MRIIKYGTPHVTLQTTCRTCGCVFETADDELHMIKDTNVVIAICPCCGKVVITNFEHVNATDFV